MFVPYDYQESCLDALRIAREKKAKRALVVMASGLGKTATVGFDVRDWLKKKPSARVLYLCHQNRILSQARETFQDVVNGDLDRYGYYHGLVKERESQFLFGSFQTMTGHYHEFKRDAFDYVVVDEGPHGPAETYEPVIRYFKPRFLLGVTATPDRHDLQDIRSIFGKEIYTLNLPEALARNYLTPVDYRLITDELVDVGQIENPYRLSIAELNRRIFVPRRDEEIVRIIREKAQGIPDPKIITFCNSIRHANRFHEHFEGSLPVHSGLHNDEQDERVRSFQRGQVENLITVDKFNEGVDIPEINVVVFLRSTQSYTIFYQQLGRGLRKAKGKKKVLVLDFVANCERIRLIDSLNQEIERERKKLQGARGSCGTDTNTTTIDFGRFNFTEKARDILAILGKVEDGYTKDVLIAQLQAEAKRLKRTPTQIDMDASSKEGRTASGPTFTHRFGSWNRALEAAELRVNRRRSKLQRTEEELVQKLQAEAKRLGRTPTIREIDAAVSSGIFERVFGTWNKALEAAGLSVCQAKGVTQKSLIAQLRTEAKRLKKPPTLRDMGTASKEGRASGPTTFVGAFGTWNKALEAAKLSINSSPLRGCTPEALIAQLQAEAKRLKRTPTKKDIDVASRGERTASPAPFLRTFGSWNKTLAAAGFQAKKKWKKHL